jgi:hypothetical protein
VSEVVTVFGVGVACRGVASPCSRALPVVVTSRVQNPRGRELALRSDRLLWPIVLALLGTSPVACQGRGLSGKLQDAGVSPDLGIERTEATEETAAIGFVDADDAGTMSTAFAMSDAIDLGRVVAGTAVSGRIAVTANRTLFDLTCTVLGPNLTADPSLVCPPMLAAGAT